MRLLPIAGSRLLKSSAPAPPPAPETRAWAAGRKTRTKIKSPSFKPEAPICKSQSSQVKPWGASVLSLSDPAVQLQVCARLCYSTYRCFAISKFMTIEHELLLRDWDAHLSRHQGLECVSAYSNT